MANRRIKRKASGGCGSAVGGASGNVGGMGSIGGRYGFSSTQLVTPSTVSSSVGPVTVREQLTAIRGATKPNSGSQISFTRLSISSTNSQFSSNSAMRSRLHPLQPTHVDAVGTHLCLNRCYSSRGANIGLGITANPSNYNNNSTLRQITPALKRVTAIQTPTTNLPLAARLSFPNTLCSNAIIVNTSDKNSFLQKTKCDGSTFQPLVRTTILNNESAVSVAEEFEADREVELINSNFGHLTSKVATGRVNKRRKITRNSPRLKSIRKLRPSPRTCKSPGIVSFGLQPQAGFKTATIQKRAKRQLKISSPIKQEHSNPTLCLDALKQRQKQLQKIVITLKRKPRQFINLKQGNFTNARTLH